jgi:DNA-binding IclR family transcriptional regulator
LHARARSRAHPAEHRGLSTARAVLSVLRLLAASREGVRADEVARHLEKSVSTAYNLLASLCDEGVAERRPGGRYSLAGSFRRLVIDGAASPELDDLSGVVEDLLARTHKRAYLGVVRDGRIEVALERGLQGMPRMPGLEPVLRDNAHALAIGKVVLALARPDAVERYARAGLARFTPNTITRPQALYAELRRVRHTGVAIDREEFGEDFCCLATPILDPSGRFLGAVGISMTRRAFDEERDALAETLRDVAQPARFQLSAETRTVLERDPGAHLASAPSTLR